MRSLLFVLVAVLNCAYAVAEMPIGASAIVKVQYPIPEVTEERNMHENLRNQWLNALFQKMSQTRLGEAAFIPIVPKSLLSFSKICPENDAGHLLAELLCQIDAIAELGFTLQEFESAKTQALEMLASIEPSAEAVYYIEQFLKSEGDAARDLFVQVSREVLESLTLQDIHQQAVALLTDENRLVQVVPLGGGHACELPIVLAADVGQGDIQAFYRLPLIDWEKDTIRKIITTVADKNVLELGLRKKSIDKRGKKINHVHPLRFISYIFGDPHLRKCMREIRKSHFKWNGFMEGFSRRMKEEAHNDNVLPYISGFSNYLNVNAEQVMPYIEQRDWEGLVKFLF